MDQKCARYWPVENEVEEFGHMFIMKLAESKMKNENNQFVDDLILRKLELRNDSKIGNCNL